MKHLRNVVDGMASVFDSFSTSRAYVTNLGGFSRDSKVLAQDARTFANDFRKQSDLVYGETTTSTGTERKG
jgi:hypothetical protein